MSIRITVENPQEFFTNQDIIRGQVVFSLSRAEHVGAITVKLEGESRTALGMPIDGSGRGISQRTPGQAGDVVHENHKILYKVAQVFPAEDAPPQAAPFVLAPGQHRFPFQFKFPFNNMCSNPAAMSKLGGLAGAGGFASGSGLFGLGGIRVMDGTRQLMYTHVTKTLPPSFTGFPGEAEVRYYLKVTVQRPGLFKENWRYHTGLKFQPIEPPRPTKTNQEAYARRPFAFRPRSPRPVLETRKRTSFFSGRHGGSSQAPSPSPTPDGNLDVPGSPSASTAAPSIEMSARLPHPAILTCNKPIPLRLIAKKVIPTDATEVFLIALQINLLGKTNVRCQDLVNTETTSWVVLSKQGLQIPLSRSGDPVGTELVIPDALWSNVPLPNTVMPSFVTCNLGREYQLEVKVGLAWGKPPPASTSLFPGKGKSRLDSSDIPQEIHLPLHFSKVEVYSGLTPPEGLLAAMRQGQSRRRPGNNNPQRRASQPSTPITPASLQQPPRLPPRATQPQQQQQQPQAQQTPITHDALYPPQLAPGQEAPPYDDAPPSYDEAMAEEMTGPMIPPSSRPAYSGVTNENSPSTLPEKS
ncbi:hypothetical protein B0H66DRAFT_549420 [Apodospora peruviana]|uniref:Arrestin-like N-terminal domain-containing protein n=1 Tax=Apodospora peruviana TaxID=516989 RepID=A0AAE0MCB3_9PEZI|nr:hypothetical protein B0H66DRAFT_549420 [Apodospora peruviana]